MACKGVIDLSEPADESTETVVARVRPAFDHTTPDRIVVGTDCGMNYLPRCAAFGKMQAMAVAAEVLRAS